MYIELRNHSGLKSSAGAKCLAITLRRAGKLAPPELKTFYATWSIDI
jgi:hypothetical protein